jgi:histo-blood group ABO system transferase
MDNTTSKKSVGIITIATGRYYDEFIPALKKSVDTYLNHPSLDIHFYCFTDSVYQAVGVHHSPIKHLAWPFSTLMRFHWIAKEMPVLEQNDFLLYMDADMKLVSPMPAEIFNHPLIAVQHPGFIEGSAPFELDRTESAYVAPPLRQHYFQGCFWGGETPAFKALISHLAGQVTDDLAKAAIPIWHDESYLNHYLASRDCFPLSPRFAWPQGVPAGQNTPYVLHLEKPHNQIRQVDENRLDLDVIISDQNQEAQLQFYKRLYLTSHEKCQRLELRLAQKNTLWLQVKEWLAYYKNRNNISKLK